MMAEQERGGRFPAEAWATAAVRAVVVLASAFLAFAFFPDWLTEFLATRVSPTVRDLLVLLWWIFAAVAITILFVVVQPRRGRP